jgi:hypothetical protein
MLPTTILLEHMLLEHRVERQMTAHSRLTSAKRTSTNSNLQLVMAQNGSLRKKNKLLEKNMMVSISGLKAHQIHQIVIKQYGSTVLMHLKTLGPLLEIMVYQTP